MRTTLRVGMAFFICLAVGAAGLQIAGAQAQPFDKQARVRAKRMLAEIKESIQINYYDPAFHGIDVNARFKQAEQQLDEATTFSMANAVIAQTLLDFGDSHLYFLPPERPSTYEYGWVLRMVGDRCLVMAVKPGSDAATKGLKPGDTLLRIETFTPARANFWKLRYLYYTLSPRPTLKLTVQSPGGAPRDMEIAVKVTLKPAEKDISLEGMQKTIDQEAQETLTSTNRTGHAGDVAIWKLAGFEFEPGDTDRVVDAAVKGASALVIDMRGNGGGYVETLRRVAARLFDHDVTLATVKMRKSSKPMLAKPKKPVFTGKIVLIVDADSASAAEVLARTMQLEGRGTVIGDQSAGAVMQAFGFQSLIPGLEDSAALISGTIFGASITNADLIMKDGKSLEHVGVTPDERLLPVPEDLAAGLDKVLARAVAMAGATLDPTAAGKMFPVEWKKK